MARLQRNRRSYANPGTFAEYGSAFDYPTYAKDALLSLVGYNTNQTAISAPEAVRTPPTTTAGALEIAAWWLRSASSSMGISDRLAFQAQAGKLSSQASFQRISSAFPAFAAEAVTGFSTDPVKVQAVLTDAGRMLLNSLKNVEGTTLFKLAAAVPAQQAALGVTNQSIFGRSLDLFAQTMTFGLFKRASTLLTVLGVIFALGIASYGITAYKFRKPAARAAQAGIETSKQYAKEAGAFAVQSAKLAL